VLNEKITEKRKKMTEASASVCFILATALHAYCNSERPAFHELITNGSMNPSSGCIPEAQPSLDDFSGVH